MGKIMELLKQRDNEKQKRSTSVRELLADDTVAGSINDRINNYMSSYENFVSQANNRYKGYDYSTYDKDGAQKFLEQATKQNEWLTQESQAIQNLLKTYGGMFAEDDISNINDALGKTTTGWGKILRTAQGDVDYWSGVSTDSAQYEKDYDNYVFGEMYKDFSYEEMLEERARSGGRKRQWITDNLDSFMTSYEARDKAALLDNQIRDLERIKGRAVLGSPEDEEVAALKQEKSRYLQLGNIKEKAERLEFYKKYYKNDALAYANSQDKTGAASTYEASVPNKEYLKEDELAILAYLNDTKSKEYADKYASLLRETLNERAGASAAESIQSLPAVPEWLLSNLTAFTAGAAGWFENMGQAFINTEIPTSSLQFANQALLEDQTGLNQYIHQAAFTVGNMLPSILISKGASALGASSTVAGAIGSGTLGLSASGSAYKQALQEGYDANKARAYGLLVGASEAALEYALGGITALGGVGEEVILQKISAIDNAIARVTLSGLVNIGSEITEEELQAFLEPYIRTLIMGEEYTPPTVQELVETALITALSTGAIQSIPNISAEIERVKADTARGQSLINRGGYSSLRDLANAVTGANISPKAESKVSKLVAKTEQGVKAIENKTASERTSKKTARNVARLSEAVDSAMASQNIAEIESALLKEGMSKSEARRASKILTRALGIESLTEADLSKVKNSEAMRKVFRDIIENEDSSIYKRAENYSAIARGESTEQNKTSASKVTSLVKDSSRRVLRASENGQTIDETTGNAVSILDVVSVKDGTMMLKVKDGDSTYTVDASNVSFSSEDEALVYEAVANMTTSPDVAKSLIDNYRVGKASAKDYVIGAEEAFRYGKYGLDINELSNADNLAYGLDEAQRDMAYKLGQMSADRDISEIAKKLKEAALSSTSKSGSGRVLDRDTGEVFDKKSLKSDQQKAGVVAAEIIAKVTGKDIYLFES